jgi:hypothetical protein
MEAEDEIIWAELLKTLRDIKDWLAQKDVVSEEQIEANKQKKVDETENKEKQAQ